MRIQTLLVVLLTLAGPVFSAAAKKAKTKPTAKRPSVARPKMKSVRTRTPARAKTGTKTSTKSAGSKVSKVSKKSRRGASPSSTTASRSLLQGQPSTERFHEIQQALFTKGYLKNEATGQWNAESVDALKRFQAEQGLTSDGKLNSLSLIALGLGPKRALTAQTRLEKTQTEPRQ